MGEIRHNQTPSNYNRELDIKDHLHLPGGPFGIDISKHDEMKHFVEVDDHSEHIAESKNHDDSGQYDCYTLISPLSGCCLLVHAASSLHGLVQQGVEDRENYEGDEDHHQKVGNEDIVSDIVCVVPEISGAHRDVDRLPGHDDRVLLEADVEGRHWDCYC